MHHSSHHAGAGFRASCSIQACPRLYQTACTSGYYSNLWASRERAASRLPATLGDLQTLSHSLPQRFKMTDASSCEIWLQPIMRSKVVCDATSNGSGAASGPEQENSELVNDFMQLVGRADSVGVKIVLLGNQAKLVSNKVVNKEALQGLTQADLVKLGLNKGAAAILKKGFPATGPEQEDSKLVNDFMQLVKKTDNAAARSVLLRNQAKLVSNKVVNKEALQGLMEADLVKLGLKEGAAAILKKVFPATGTKSGLLRNQAKLQQLLTQASRAVSAREWMANTTFVPAIYAADVPSWTTKSVHAMVPKQVQCWEGFDQLCMSWFDHSFDSQLMASQLMLSSSGATPIAARRVYDVAGVRCFLDCGVFEYTDAVLLRGVLGMPLQITKPSGLVGEPDRGVCVAGTPTHGSHTILPIDVNHSYVIAEAVELHTYAPPDDLDNRTSLQRVVERAYGNMVENGFSYAVICDDMRFWFAKIVDGCLYISRTVHCTQVRPTVIIALCYIASLALQQKRLQRLVTTGPQPPATNTADTTKGPQSPTINTLEGTQEASHDHVRQRLAGSRAAKCPSTYSASDVGLGRLLGCGSVASVYEGAMQGVPAAIKVAHQEMHPTEEQYSPAEAEQRLQHEVAAYGRLEAVQGEFVPCLLAHGTMMSGAHEPFPFLPTSRVGDGLPLTEAAAKLQPSQLPAVARAAMTAVKAIHHLGVVHGDVRPPNVLLDADGSVKLVDFSEANLQPQPHHCDRDVRSMLSVLTDVAQQCLKVSREQAAAVVQQWLHGMDAP